VNTADGQRRRRRILVVGVVWVAALAVLCVIADRTVEPATARLPQTIYVDAAFGHDDGDGRTPETAFKTLDEALPHARPGAQVLLLGYSTTQMYSRPGEPCVTVRGKPGAPITIAPNVYTNRLRSPVLTTRVQVYAPFTRLSQVAGLARAAVRRADGSGVAWRVRWPHDPRLHDGSGFGFVVVGQVPLSGWPTVAPARQKRGSWWSDGWLYVRMRPGENPNHYKVVLKDGPGLCLSSRSRYVVVKQFTVVGAVRPVEVEPGARHISVLYVYGQDVVRNSLIPRSATDVAPSRQGGVS